MFNFLNRKENKKNERIYFDHASATQVSDIAKKSYLKILDEGFANSASIHFEGEKSKEILFEARKKIAKFLHTKSGNIYFAASTTEANNIFIKGVENSEVIYSKSDHSSIVEVVESLKSSGARLINITPDKIGRLRAEDVVSVLTPNTKLICFSYVHSELGTVQEVKKISSTVREFWIKNKFDINSLPKIFIDASQAVKYFDIDVSNLNVDGISFGAGKLGGVPGCAVLYVKNQTKINSIISGGGQEEGIRSGTENLAAIVSLSEVLSTPGKAGGITNREYVAELRNYAITKLEENFTESELEIFGDIKFKYNKYFEHSAPHILLISLGDILGEELCLRLDAKGISVSPATACSLLENSGSNFLKSIKEPVKAKETVRLSFSETNTKKEIDYFVEVLKDIKNKYQK